LIKLFPMLLIPALISTSPAGAHAQKDETSALRAGAASIDITPPESALRPGDRIRDHLYARALVIKTGTTCAVLVGLDQGMIGNEAVDAATTRIVSSTGCPKTNIVISATHTHSGSTHGIEAGGEPGAKQVENAIVDSVKKAAARLRPARIGFGTTNVYLNVNRDLYSENQWLQGPNIQGISDKTLAVLELLGEDDLPIGVYMSYALHPISFYLSGVVSADVPGEASRYVERRYGPDMVTIFVQGASGDQNPFLTRPLYKLVETRAGVPTANDRRISRPAPWLEMARERNASIRLTEGLKTAVPADRLPAYEAAIRDQSELVSAMGAVIGETALNTMRYDIQSKSGSVGLRGAGASIECPGRDRTDRDNPVREGHLPPYTDGAPVVLELRVLRIGEIYIASINGEIYSEIGLRLKREAPVSRLMLTTLANGIANSGYIYSNEAGSHLTFQVIGSRLKPGCAEDKIVSTFLELISEVQP